MKKSNLINKLSPQKISFPSKNAELVGIILGDGNIHAYKKGTKVRSYQIRIAGDNTHDNDYLTNYIPQLYLELFNKQAKFYKAKTTNELLVYVCNKEIVEFFERMGLKPGNKIKNQTTIPQWIWQNNEYLKACVRGLIDTDGSLYELTPHWPGLFQITFENRNITLLKDTRKALQKLGFIVSKLCGNRAPEGTKFYITRKKEIEKYFKEIGFSNKKHLKKVQKVRARWCSGQFS